MHEYLYELFSIVVCEASLKKYMMNNKRTMPTNPAMLEKYQKGGILTGIF